MMWRKATRFPGNQELAAAMLHTTDPAELKAMGRSVQNFVELVWQRERLDIMVAGCYAKFSWNSRLGDELLATGDRILVEASPSDRIWGIGLRATDADALDPRKWRGLNLLGQALMHVRDRLKAERAAQVRQKELYAAIRLNANYGGHPDGVLHDEEMESLHHKVETALATMNGDAGECTISARQLALLLGAVVENATSGGPIA
ncbi:TPA: NADAR family protein [Burkholderia vietnamiensis]|nr:NADAR family protein [Burkholderia vietnamiensis]